MNMFFRIFFLYNIFIITFTGLTTGEVGEKCDSSDDVFDGICTVITDCEVAIRAIRMHNFHNFKRCGFEGAYEIVCCPKTTPRFGETTKAPATLRKTDRECKKIVENSIPPLDLHIIGGETASLGEFPHMVALGYERDNGYEFDCGGTLLSDTFVLTAAHCVDTLDRVAPSIARMGLVEIGGSVFNEDSDITVADIIKHPGYTKREKYHDLALIRLSRSVQMNSYQNAACLYTSNSEPSTELTVTGWGTTSAVRNVRSRVLLKANVTLVERNECSTSYTNWRKLPRGIAAEQLCAGDPERRRDTCQGDSGGPLQVLGADGQYRVLGITSFGRSCAGAAPGVYTRLTHYLDWIEGLVWPDN